MGTTKTGRPCRAAALRDSGFCAFHDPSETAKKKRHDGRSLGGSRRRPVGAVAALTFDFEDVTQIPSILERLAELRLNRVLSIEDSRYLHQLIETRIKFHNIITAKEERAEAQAEYESISRQIEADRNTPATQAEADELMRFVPDHTDDVLEYCDELSRKAQQNNGDAAGENRRDADRPHGQESAGRDNGGPDEDLEK